MIANSGHSKRGPSKERSRVPGAPYTIDQAADAVNLSPRTVRERIRAGLLVAYKDGHFWRITERAVAAYLASRERSGGSLS